MALTPQQRRDSALAARNLQLLRQQFAVRSLLSPAYRRDGISFDPTPQASRDKTAKIQGRGW